MERRLFKDLKIGHKLLVSHLMIAFLSIAMITVVSYVSATFFLHKNVSVYNPLPPGLFTPLATALIPKRR